MTIIDELEANGRVFDTQARTLRDVLDIAYDVKHARASVYQDPQNTISGLVGAIAANAIVEELHAHYFALHKWGRSTTRMDLLCIEHLQLILHNGCFGCGNHAIVLIDFNDLILAHPACHAIIRYPVTWKPTPPTIDIPDVEWKSK